MFKLKYYLFLLFVLGIFQNVKATHNRAGEITYKWLFGYTYEIKVTTYTNIGGTNLADRCEDTVYFGDGTRAIVLRSNGPLGVCAPAKDGLPLNASIKINEYVTSHAYPGPGNYKISMEDPNRNSGVLNIPNSVNQSFYIESLLVIPTFGSGNNSSPVLSFPPIDNGCVLQCFYHNPGAYDIDGDSISYELTSCKGNKGLICPGYALPSSGGGVLEIDSLTGTLAWCNPQFQGLYNFAMIIKEWRLDNSGSYSMIGYIIRDMQIDVGSCSNIPPHITFSHIDTCILVGTTLTNTINASDINGDLISLYANGNSFTKNSNPSTFISIPGDSIVSGIYNWNTDSTHIRRLPYQVTLKVKDNNPSISLTHFKTFNIKILPYPPENLSTTASVDTITLKWNRPSSFLLSGTNKFTRYRIYRKTGVSTWIHNYNETIPPTYTGFVFIGYSGNNINDTLFYDHNIGSIFTSAQVYSYVVLAEYSDGTTSYVSNISSTQAIVGVEEMDLFKKIILYPNPTNKFLNISFYQNNQNLIAVDLFDITGKNIYKIDHDIYKMTPTTVTIDIGDLAPGVYILKIIGTSNNVNKKIIKQ